MAVETQIIPVGENEQVTLTAPRNALALRRVNKNTVEVFPVSEKDLLTLVGAEERVELAEEVRDFSAAAEILPFVEKAIQAARAVFAGADRVTASLKRDEYGETFVDVDVVVRDDPDAEAEKYSACVEKWASFMPPDAAGQIHLSTSWAEK